MKRIPITTMLGFCALLFFSCNNEDFLSQTEGGEPCDYICFSIPTDEGAQTKGSIQADAKEYTSDRFVLRSANSADTLCVRTIVSEGIQGAAADQAITRGTPVTAEAFYNKFHVLTVRDQESSFFMNEDVTKTGNSWTMDNTYYWPGADHTLQFYAWAPANAITAAPTSPNNMTFTYTVPTDATKQQDLVVANKSHEGDFNQVVSLPFQHICTAVKFVVGEQMQAGTIKSVALKDVKYEGSYDMTTGQWSLTDEQKSFSQTLNKRTTGSEIENTEITPADGTFMMLPQTLPTGASVEVVFQDGATGSERTLSATIGGTEWLMGSTVTYKLSITPEYELEFISEPELQDAHYVIYPIHIKAKDVPGNGEWTLTSTASEVTLRTELTTLTKRGYWIEEDRGEIEISSTAYGEDITVYAFLEENTTKTTRKVKLELRPTEMPNATPATFTISQLCPSWNGNLGCERLEDGEYPWGFLWDSTMKIIYDATTASVWDRIILAFYLGLVNNDKFVYQDINLIPYRHDIIIDFSQISPVDVAESPDNGITNTSELYNFNGINEASALMDVLKEMGATPDITLPTNPTEFAARMCIMKNKFNKEITQEQGENVERAILKPENLVWYLPAQNEVMQMKDTQYPLDGDYWTSTAIHDNQNAYKYTAGGSTSLKRRDVKLHVRAVRKKP